MGGGARSGREADFVRADGLTDCGLWGRSGVEKNVCRGTSSPRGSSPSRRRRLGAGVPALGTRWLFCGVKNNPKD